MALPFQQQPNLQVVQGGPTLDTEGVILERLKLHVDQDHKNIQYGMRLILANYLDLTTDGNTKTAQATEGRYNDILNKRWEEGRHNPIQTNTLIQVKSLVFSEPDIKWSGCTGKHPMLVSETRKAYYLKYWREQNWDYLYKEKLLDLLTGGESSVQVGVREGKPFMEWLDCLGVTWDTAYKDPAKKRFVFVDKEMPISDALRYYPKLAGKVKMPGKDGVGGEAQIVVTFYWSNTTSAVFYKKAGIELGPNPYGKIPVVLTTLIHLLSSKYAAGMVETQIGTYKEHLRAQRYFRETWIKGVGVDVLKGSGWDEESLDDWADGVEGTLIRTSNPSADFDRVPAVPLADGALKRYEQLNQNLNSESGVNDFMRSQTDTQVDFASQLAYIAQESGVQGKFTAQVHEHGLKEDARLFMEIAARFEQGPITLSVQGQDFTFDKQNPIRPLLGSDGEIEVKPMTYKSPAQKLQETMILGQVLAIGMTLPPPLMMMYIDQCLTAYEIDSKDDILEQIQEMQQAQAQAQQQSLQQAMQPPTGMGQDAAMIGKAMQNQNRPPLPGQQ